MLSVFAASSLPVYRNFVKNVLFRLATLLIQLTIYKLFSFLAFKSNAYTSFLMFNEDHAQKFFFVLSRGLTRRSMLVLAFAIFFGFGNLYDTLLWALDSPGYVTRSTLVTASSATNQLLANPAYLVFMSDPAEDPASLDIDQAVAGNLFVQGFNFTLPEPVKPGARDVVPTNQSLSTAGPRIWLDDAGFSVGVDQLITVTGPTVCPARTLNTTLQVWNCQVNNSDALTVLKGQAAQPQIWWDNSPYTEDHFLGPDRRDNPWMSLGTGGDTAAMKQVFTVTKENRRHTFLQSIVKVTMVTLYPTTFDGFEITDLVRRMFSDDPGQPLTPDIKTIADFVISAQTNQTSLTLGFSQQEKYSVLSNRIELLNVMNSFLATEQLYTSLRIIYTNITLIRSETLPNPVMPYGKSADCQSFFTNLATGGRVRSTDCYKSVGNQTNARFLGQLDASAVFILTDVLGDGRQSVSAAALNQTGVDWYLRNSPHIDDLLIARGLILGGDRDAVPLAVQVLQPAISYLQLLLLLLSVVVAIAVMVLVKVCESTGYYTNSFLSAVCATMHIDGRDGTTSCTKAGYLHKPPEIELVNAGQHVVISTSGRVFTTVVGSDDEGARALVKPICWG